MTLERGALATGFAAVQVALGVLIAPGDALAQTPDSLLSPGALKQMSLEQLMEIEVTSVSRRPEHLAQAAAAIQVITREDIRRSGATRLPEALRLATNLEVAQLDASQWAISARGFNSPLANKLLVLIDGRTVYSPLFAGTFWDQQDVMLEDVERIEVISGPGATIWGANAVNGVINITTRAAADTRGLLAVGGGGSELHGVGALRYGSALGSAARFRAYGKYWDRDGAALATGEDVANDWTMGQGGFRLDWDASAADLITVQGDLYDQRTDQALTASVVAKGANVIGRWSRRLSDRSDLKLQAYVDRVHRLLEGDYDDRVTTYDLDTQHHILLGERHDLVWGLGYRRVHDEVAPPAPIFDPPRITLETFSGFAQDEITLHRRLSLTVGTKVEHDPYTGWELQPSVRMAWTPGDRQTLWSAVSRAVRTPSRLDRNFVTLPGSGFESEHLVAYELGYRVRPDDRVSLSASAFYNDYHDLRSFELNLSGGPIPVRLGNGQKGKSYGVELVAHWRPTRWWQLQLGHTELRVEIRPQEGSVDQSHGAREAADSKHRFTLRSSLDLPANLELDAGFRYLSRITNPTVDAPAYGELDLRLGWTPLPRLDLSLVGQNLLHQRHREFATAVAPQVAERGVFARAVWGF